jgi:hypothetical protein
MSRIGLVAAVTAVVGVSLAGCSSMSSSSSAEQAQALNFESDPPGAEIRTTEGLTCTTPCALTVPSQDQTVAISKDGYVPQTLQVTTGPQPEHSFWQHPPPTLVPNPVHVVLKSVAKPVHHARSHKPPVSASAPLAQGPTAQGPTAQGPTAQAPTTQGPTTQGSTTQGPTTQDSAARFSAFPPPPSK